ncbi:Hypothetical protein PHPALM_15498 [Phytophthora palmivora]|uniref:Uncharacterized protein n=1 Tax=Phytophthora palmivora TaxID=4796 RepID=A0A2P4XS20_9STRA|nr:Hypothetical protein PHPALM_15498 [Phytophthora palmivora]
MATRLALGAGLLAYGEKDALAEDGAGDKDKLDADVDPPTVAGGRGNAVMIRGGCMEPLLLIGVAFLGIQRDRLEKQRDGQHKME